MNFRDPQAYSVARRPARGDWAKALRCQRLTGHKKLMYEERGKKKSSRLSFKIQALKIIVGRGEIQLSKSLHNIIHFHSSVLLGNVSEESEQSMEGQSP